MVASSAGSSDANFLHEHVFEGIWDKYDEPAYSRRIWTLQSHKVFFIMAALVILAEFAGSRSWVIARYALLHGLGRPVRMDGEEPLLHLSQGGAIQSSFPSMRKVFLPSWTAATRLGRRSGRLMPGRRPRAPRHDPAQSVWFGIVAIGNLVLFIAMGIAIPALLTDGAFGAPIVKSRAVQDCLASDWVAGWVHYTMNLPRTDAIFQQCFDEVNQACSSQYYFTSPAIEKKRLDYCPFPKDVCQNNTKPFEITHMNISAYEVGVNSPSQLTLNHRLTCAPVVVENFQLFPSLSPNYSWVSARATLDKSPDSLTSFSVRLSTVNGPNFLSNESSGLRMALEQGPMDVTALPRHFVSLDSSIAQYQEHIHEGIRRDDGQSFLIVHRAGRSLYYSTVDDPFFAAHNLFNYSDSVEPYFMPDHEATALGCVEQYQFCIPTLSGPLFCTSWGYKNQRFGQHTTFMNSGLVGWDQAIFAVSEEVALFFDVTEALAVYYYLALRNVLHSLSPLLRDQTSNIRGFYSVDEPWALEVETWFMKAIINTIFRVRMGAEYHFANFSNFESDPRRREAFVQQWALCGRVLFRDGDYTNINWVGFCTTTAALLLICFVSYLVGWIHACGKILFELVTDPYGTVIKIRLWRTRSYFYIPPTRRTWYGHWPREAQEHTRDSEEVDLASAPPSREGLNDYDMDDLQNAVAIDNPLP